MNIFWLDNDPRKNAASHCDKHVVKMIVEYAQLLSTAVRIANGRKITQNKKTYYLLRGEKLGTEGEILNQRLVYKVAHVNHPCSVWARESFVNWSTLHVLAICLCEEYTRRYGKIHKCEALIRGLPDPKLNGDATPKPQCMPEQYRGRNVVTAYRKLYIESKSRFCTWRNGEVPLWYARVHYPDGVKTADSEFGGRVDRTMMAAIVKGLIEHKDASRFFGSTMALTHYLDLAEERELLTGIRRKPTSLAREWYKRCLAQLPQSRQAFWTDVGSPVVKQ